MLLQFKEFIQGFYCTSPHDIDSSATIMLPSAEGGKGYAIRPCIALCHKSRSHRNNFHVQNVQGPLTSQLHPAPSLPFSATTTQTWDPYCLTVPTDIKS